MSRTLLGTTCNDVCLSSYFPILSKFLDDMEKLHVNFSFVIKDDTNKEIKRSFYTIKEMLANDIINSSNMKNVLFYLNEIDTSVFKEYKLTFKLDNNTIYEFVGSPDGEITRITSIETGKK